MRWEDFYLECPHGLPNHIAKNHGCPDCLNEMRELCRGVRIAGKDWSGCNAHQTGATDCPSCGHLIAARAKEG